MNPHVSTAQEVAKLDDFHCCLETCDPPRHVTKQRDNLTNPQSLLHICVISASGTAIKNVYGEVLMRRPCSRVRSVVLC